MAAQHLPFVQVVWQLPLVTTAEVLMSTGCCTALGQTPEMYHCFDDKALQLLGHC